MVTGKGGRKRTGEPVDRDGGGQRGSGQGGSGRGGDATRPVDQGVNGRGARGVPKREGGSSVEPVGWGRRGRGPLTVFGDQTGPSEASWSTGPAGGTGDEGRVVDQLTDRGWGEVPRGVVSPSASWSVGQGREGRGTDRKGSRGCLASWLGQLGERGQARARGPPRRTAGWSADRRAGGLLTGRRSSGEGGKVGPGRLCLHSLASQLFTTAGRWPWCRGAAVAPGGKGASCRPVVHRP